MCSSDKDYCIRAVHKRENYSSLGMEWETTIPDL